MGYLVFMKSTILFQCISIFIFVVTINSYNLIDGIDGLAGGYGIIAMIAFLFLSLSAKNTIGLILCVTIIGSLSGFLKFNLDSGKEKSLWEILAL